MQRNMGAIAVYRKRWRWRIMRLRWRFISMSMAWRANIIIINKATTPAWRRGNVSYRHRAISISRRIMAKRSRCIASAAAQALAA